MSEEWGPWIEHDGRGCPPSIMGKVIEAEFTSEDGLECTGYRVLTVDELVASCESWNAATHMGSGADGGWDGKSFPMEYVIRYRIRKPRALQDLIKLVEELPEGVDA